MSKRPRRGGADEGGNSEKKKKKKKWNHINIISFSWLIVAITFYITYA